MVERLPRRRTCYLTGWALHPGARNMYRDCDLVLPFSDHAGWNELVRTAVESGATQVYTVHGHDALARHLCAIGIRAEHLADHPAFADPAPDPAEDAAVPDDAPRPPVPEIPL